MPALGDSVSSNLNLTPNGLAYEWRTQQSKSRRGAEEDPLI